MSDKNTRYYKENKERLKRLAKERYRKNPEKYQQKNKDDRKRRGKEYWHKWYRRLKLELFFALGGRCEKCGYNKLIMKAYDIHHVDRSTKKKDERMSMGHITKKQVRGLIQLHKEGKVKLLCCRCHREEENE